MYVENFTYNAPKTEYCFDSDGKLLKAVPTGQTGTVTIYILCSDEGKLLKNRDDGSIVGEQKQISSPDEEDMYEEIFVEDVNVAETEG